MDSFLVCNEERGVGESGLGTSKPPTVSEKPLEQQGEEEHVLSWKQEEGAFPGRENDG